MSQRPQPSARRDSVCPGDAPPHVPGRPSVTIVTDDLQLTETFATALRERGYNVTTARHSGHALLACLQGQAVDILVAELSMEDGTGPALMQRLRRYNPNLRALFVGKPEPVPGATVAADSRIDRPFTSDELVARLERLMENEAS